MTSKSKQRGTHAVFGRVFGIQRGTPHCAILNTAVLAEEADCNRSFRGQSVGG